MSRSPLPAYRLLSGRSRDIMLFFCTDQKIVGVNPVAEAAAGYSPAELPAVSLQDLRNEGTGH